MMVKGGDRISVLIPTYNRAELVKRAIRSVLESSWEDLQVIVSDNGSTDATVEAAKEAASGDRRVIILQNTGNRGPIPNWKQCLDHATGDWIHWLWSDDWVSPDFYSKLIHGMRETGAGMAFSAARIIDTDNGWSFIRYSYPGIAHLKTQMLKLAFVGNEIPVSPAACLLPRKVVVDNFFSCIPKTGNIDCNSRAIGCDALMIIASIDSCELIYTDSEPLVFFNYHPDSITVSSPPGLVEAHYAWARIWWARKRGLSWRFLWMDAFRLGRSLNWGALGKAMFL